MRGRRLHDIIVPDSSLENLASSAPLANPDRLWPSGVVEYEYYGSVPGNIKKLVQEAMAYITSKVPCITFKLKTSYTRDYVTIYNGPDCSSDTGRVGGQQSLSLNRSGIICGICGNCWLQNFVVPSLPDVS